MRIGFDAKRIFHNSTGLGNYGRDVVRILSEHTNVSCFYLFNTKQSNIKFTLPERNATVVFPESWFWKSFPSLWRLLGQWKQIMAYDLDLYHGLSGEIPYNFRKKSVAKTVTIHDLIFLSHPHYYNFWDRLIYKLKFRYACRTVDHIIAISKETKSEIIKYFNVDEKKISVVYQGCHALFKTEIETDKKNAVKDKYRLPSEYVLYVGTLQERKNALTLIKAVEGTEHQLVLVGKEKKYARKLYDYVEKHHLQSQITFIKDADLEQLVAIYQNATVFCYPSFCEGFGIPIIEALYSKVPVVTTKSGCFPEAAGPDSIFIDPSSPEDIRNKIVWLFQNPTERKKIAEKGYQYAQQFNDENVAKNLINTYKKIL
ncbi:glycosyltransferase family 4 protein [Muricauda sp. NFXS6]|uniref:glycosyltransferase family 4 protein n=1 Tax=Allomuricauda sp. NFXS6 TaxID=2819094 RepID=UPI0032E03DA7